MAESIGLVLGADIDGWARVVTDRRGACGGCHPSGGGCRGCLSSSKMESRVANPIDARAGDIVRLNLPTANLLKGAALVYLLPVAALILGAVGGVSIGVPLGFSEAAGVAGGGFFGLALGFAALILYGRGNKKRMLTPTITAVVPNHGLSTASPAAAFPKSCCG